MPGAATAAEVEDIASSNLKWTKLQKFLQDKYVPGRKQLKIPSVAGLVKRKTSTPTWADFVHDQLRHYGIEKQREVEIGGHHAILQQNNLQSPPAEALYDQLVNHPGLEKSRHLRTLAENRPRDFERYILGSGGGTAAQRRELVRNVNDAKKSAADKSEAVQLMFGKKSREEVVREHCFWFNLNDADA